MAIMNSCSASTRLLTVLTGIALCLTAQAATPLPAGDGNEVVVVVSPDSDIARLSRNQIVDLFLGRSSQFPDGRRAVPVDQAEGSAARDAFTMRILERTPAQIRAHWARIIFTGRGRPPRDVADGEQVKQLVATDPNAIGYIERRLVDETVAVVDVE